MTSNPRMNAYLATAIQAAQPDDNTLRTGAVQSIDGLTLTVLINSGPVPAGYLSSYTPRVGETVAVIRQGADWLCLGAIAGPGVPSAAAVFLVPPRARLRQNVGQPMTNGAYTVLQWHVADYDTAGGWNAALNTRYTAKLAGLYHFTGKVGWGASATGQRAVVWRYNGAHIANSQLSQMAVGGIQLGTPMYSIDVPMNVGDYVEASGFHDAGVLSTSVAFPEVGSLMTVRWVGPL